MTTTPPPPEPEPLTEAAGLLVSGAIFPRRVGLRSNKHALTLSEKQPEILAGFKRGAFALYFGDEPIIHFDPLGRWQRAFVAGTHYLKGLDTQVRAIERVRVRDRLVLQRRTLDASEVDCLDAQIAHQAEAVAQGLRNGILDLVPPPAPAQPIPLEELLATLDRIAGWNAASWAAHLTGYRRALGAGPLPLLPPDCPNPLVLRPDAHQGPTELADHVREVLALLGDRLNQCRDVYLAGNGWWDRSTEDVAALLRNVATIFPFEPRQPRPLAINSAGDAPRFETIFGAIDDPTAALARNHDWAALGATNLGRIAVRLDADFARLQSSSTLIRQIKNAELGVTLMLDVDLTTADSPIAMIEALPLTRGDLIVLIHIPGDAETPEPGILGKWKAEMAARFPAPGPRLVIYNPDKQWL